MTSKLAAAFHHAGHAVATDLSQYHVIARPLRLDAYGTGEVTAALSRRKLVAGDKFPGASSRTDPDVAASIAVILCAGLVSERLAAIQGAPIAPDPERSAGDFAMARAELAQAGISPSTEFFEEAATALLTQHWASVQRLAKRLESVEELTPEEIETLLAAG
jgi:hypothetical protein